MDKTVTSPREESLATLAMRCEASQDHARPALPERLALGLGMAGLVGFAQVFVLAGFGGVGLDLSVSVVVASVLGFLAVRT